MHENKNIEPLSTKARIGVGLGAAAIGALVAGGVSSAHEMGSIDISYASELPSHDLSASPTTVHLEPTRVTTSSEQTVSQTPSFKGKATIKKAPLKTEVTSHQSTSEASIIDTKPKFEIQHSLMNLNIDKAHLTESDYQFINDNTVYLKNSGCSGSLLRNDQGVPIAETEAQHCSLRATTTPRILGSDGKTYIVQPNLVEAQTGISRRSLKTVGVVKEYFLPKAGNRTMDMAIGVFEGHTAADALAAYNKNKLTPEDISKLKLGDKASLGGWPVVQENNSDPKYMRRQNFPLIILGVTDGKDVGYNADGGRSNDDWNYKMIWAAVPISKDGAICSQGDSGGEATMVINGKRMRLGTLSLFAPFTQDYNGRNFNPSKQDLENSRKAKEKQFGVDLSNAQGICGLTYETPETITEGDVVEVVSSYSEIPIQHNTVTNEISANSELLIQKANDEFFDPNYAKTWVSGAVNLDPNGKGNWKMNPVIFYDKESGSAVIASYTDNTKDGLELDYVPDFKDQKFYGQPELNIIGGGLDVFTGLFGSNGFVGKAGGAVIGQSMNDPSTIESIQNDPAFSLYYDDSTQSLQIMQYK